MLIAGSRAGARVVGDGRRGRASDPYALGQVLYKATALALHRARGRARARRRAVQHRRRGPAHGGRARVRGRRDGAARGHAGDRRGAAVPRSRRRRRGPRSARLIGVLRVTRGAHEVITSIMLNAIVAGHRAVDRQRGAVPRRHHARRRRSSPGAELPQLGLGGSAANASLVHRGRPRSRSCGGCASRTTWGQAWRAVGRDPAAARSVGISVGAGPDPRDGRRPARSPGSRRRTS